jgi:predicted AlkP superfamily phosphohydrolase/phosphomutase
MLIIGLDGATFDLIEPWAAAGDLPHLARLMEAGAYGRMRSTVPPATFPAWTSLITGVNPGQHGVFDFTRRLPGTYQVAFINATYRQQPSMWQLLSQAGKRVAVLGLPATYPPEAINGVFVSGFDSPLATGIDRSFMHPPGLYDELYQAVGPYEITDFQELRVGAGWHEKALRKLLHAAQRRTEITTYLLDRESWDCCFVHFGESDTVAHHFWAFHDSCSPRYDLDGAAHLGHAIQTVYRALDQAIGKLLAHAGEGVTVMLVSDHGSGGTGNQVIYLNRWLAQQGWLRFAKASTASLLAGQLKRLGLALPAQLQEWAFRGPLRRLVDRLESNSRLAGINWAGTHAFSEEVNTFPAVWLNVRGREPAGKVEPGAEYEHFRAMIMSALAKWQNPVTGRTVIETVWRREDLYQGPAVKYAPDIILEPALDQGYSYSFMSSGGRAGDPMRRLAPSERIGAKGGSMNGSHRRTGVFVLSGEGVHPGINLPETQILDVAPTTLHLLGLPVPANIEGRVLAQALKADRQAIVTPQTATQAPPPESYTADQAAAVRSRLKGLGYQG